MWIHKLARAGKETRLILPVALDRDYGFRPGAFVALTVKDTHTVELRLLGTNQEDAAARLASALRLYRPARPATARHR